MTILKHENQMIETIRSYGIYDEELFSAMKKAKRHHFLPEYPVEEAYGDFPLPVEREQTVSQPYTVAFMLHHLELKKGLNVLEVGTGTGWSSAVIKELVGETGKVTSVEWMPELVLRARKILKEKRYEIDVVEGDGSKGYPENAPYDRIIVSCAPKKIMPAWIEQLKIGGVLVVPIGQDIQVMFKVTKEEEGLKKENLGYFRFVPLQEA